MAFISSNYLTDLEMTAQRILDRIDGLLAIVISDKDGVTVLKVAHPSVSDSSSTSTLLNSCPSRIIFMIKQGCELIECRTLNER